MQLRKGYFQRALSFFGLSPLLGSLRGEERGRQTTAIAAVQLRWRPPLGDESSGARKWSHPVGRKGREGGWERKEWTWRSERVDRVFRVLFFSFAAKPGVARRQEHRCCRRPSKMSRRAHAKRMNFWPFKGLASLESLRCGELHEASSWSTPAFSFPLYAKKGCRLRIFLDQSW